MDLIAAQAAAGTVAGLLKQYLRDMVEPVLTDSLLMSFYATSGRLPAPFARAGMTFRLTAVLGCLRLRAATWGGYGRH